MWSEDDLESKFHDVFDNCIQLMLEKNHDYGGSWEEDRLETLTDTIRHKIDRIRRLEELAGKGEAPKVAEGITSELRDIINYAVFRMIKEEARLESASIPHR